jgi:hypothetical protein
LSANTQAFETFLTELEPMLSQFICAHPLCPKNPSLEAISVTSNNDSVAADEL